MAKESIPQASLFYQPRRTIELPFGAIDLAGQRFGRLTVIRPVEKQGIEQKRRSVLWECCCDCGEIRYYRGYQLRDGVNKNCGCLCRKNAEGQLNWRSVDLQGQRFGRLVVLKIASERKSGHPCWECRCDCGGSATVQAANLTKGATSSCGCLRREAGALRKGKPGNKILPEGIPEFNRLLYGYRGNAKSRGLIWALSKEEAMALFQSPCFYCGVPPQQVYRMGRLPTGTRCGSGFPYNGIDRQNNEFGYTLDNVVPCCKICNRAKLTSPLDEFIEWVHRVSRHLREKGIIRE